MNKEILESLPVDQRRMIENWYMAVKRKEMIPHDFFNQCRELLGQSIFTRLFSKKDKKPPEVHNQSEIKTEQLQDIIQYAGVDLKEEAENIVKESEHSIEFSYHHEEDDRNSIGGLLNVSIFFEYVNRAYGSRGCRVSDQCYHILFMALRRKLKELFEKMIEASKLRVDSERIDYLVKIENDVRRQLWCLEQNEQKGMEKLKFKKSDSEDEYKKKIKKTIQEREDLIIKKRLSNNVALAALGSSYKSWMSIGDSPTNKETETPFQSLYSPLNERDHIKKIKERTLTMSDLLYVLEHDKRYNKSIFTIQQYFN